MRRALLLALVSSCLACGLVDWMRRPEDPASRRQVPIPFPPRNRVDLVTLNGRWMRAAEIATADFFVNDPLPAGIGEIERCLSARESYDVTVWTEAPSSPSSDGGQPDPDGGQPALEAVLQESDAGSTANILFVTIGLRPDACELGESPPLDLGATYAIDTSSWRIVGLNP